MVEEPALSVPALLGGGELDLGLWSSGFRMCHKPSALNPPTKSSKLKFENLGLLDRRSRLK